MRRHCVQIFATGERWFHVRARAQLLLSVAVCAQCTGQNDVSGSLRRCLCLCSRLVDVFFFFITQAVLMAHGTPFIEHVRNRVSHECIYCAHRARLAVRVAQLNAWRRVCMRRFANVGSFVCVCAVAVTSFLVCSAHSLFSNTREAMHTTGVLLVSRQHTERERERAACTETASICAISLLYRGMVHYPSAMYV